MNSQINVSVVIVSYNTEMLLSACLDALYAALRGISHEIVIVDNASRDGSVELIKTRYPRSRLIINTTNVGFGRANNQALDRISGRYVLLLNTDAFVPPDAISKTLAYMDAHTSCGILGVNLVGRDGKPQPAARNFPTPWNLFVGRTGLRRFIPSMQMVDDLVWTQGEVRECDWVPGCYYLVRKEVIDAVGLFDPRYFLYFEEVDHCFSTRKAGWQVVCYSDTTVVHIGGESAKSDGAITHTGRQISDIQVESELLYFRKNSGLPGVCVDVMLTSLAIGINAGKELLRTKSAARFFSYLGQIGQVQILFFRTRFGTRPTR